MPAADEPGREAAPAGETQAGYQASLSTVLREWGRIGCVGFGGPPAHIALLRKLCVDREHWLDATEFEDAISACNLLPGPASTQLAIFCASRVRGRAGALAGGVAFIVPGLAVILALSALFLAGAPPLWVKGIGAGAGAAVAAVAVQAGWNLLGPSWTRAKPAGSPRRIRWVLYLLAGGGAAAAIGPWLVLVLLGCGLTELAVRHSLRPADGDASAGHGARGSGARRRDGGRRGRPGCPGLDRVQGRGTVVRRRLRHHPADAGGRGRASLDDQRPVPERGRAGPDHSRAGRADRRRRRLRGRGRGRRPARSLDCVLALVRFRARRRPVFHFAARQQRRPGVPGRRRPCGHRRDPRLGHPAHHRPDPAMAIRGPGGRATAPARAAQRGGV